MTNLMNLDEMNQTETESNKISISWKMLLIGMISGSIWLYALIAMPMMSRIGQLEAELNVVESDMQELIGAREDVWKTNDLLTALKQQSRNLERAEKSISLVRDFRTRVEIEGFNTTAAHTSLDNIAALQRDIQKMHKQLQADSQNVKQASEAIRGLVALQNALVRDGGDVESAKSALDTLESIQKNLLTMSNENEQAKQQVSHYNDLQEQLVSIKTDQDQLAVKNLKQLTDLQENLAEKTLSVAAAIETLELLEDFQTEVSEYVVGLTGMRRDLAEILVLEKTVGNAVAALQPLNELTNIRRLDNSEIREVARGVLKNRMERIAAREAEAKSTTQFVTIQQRQDVEVAEEQLVPEPIEIDEVLDLEEDTEMATDDLPPAPPLAEFIGDTLIK